MHTFANLAKALNRSTVYLAGLLHAAYIGSTNWFIDSCAATKSVIREYRSMVL
jgi:hypothetical protein